MDDNFGIIVIQAGTVALVFGLMVMPYAMSHRAHTHRAFAAKLGVAEAIALAAWYVFGAAIVTPVTPMILGQGLLVGAVAAAAVFAAWQGYLKLKGQANG